MFKFFKKHKGDIFPIFALFICIVIVAEVMLLIMQYSNDLDTEALQRAAYYGDNMAASLNERMEYIKLRVSAATSIVSGANNRDEFEIKIENIRDNEILQDTEDVWYYKAGVLYDTESNKIQNQDNTVLQLCKAGELAVTPLVYSTVRNIRILCVYAPIKGNEFIDGLVLVYPSEYVTFVQFDETKELFDKSSLSALCDKSGEILKVLNKGTTGVETHADIFETILNLTHQKSYVDEFEQHVNESGTYSYTIDLSGTKTAVIISGTGSENGSYFIVSLYDLQNIYYGGYDFLKIALTLIIVVLVVVVGYGIYYVICRKQIDRKVFELGTTDPVLGCPTVIGFQRNVDEILKRNKVTNFAIVVAHLNHFNYLLDKFGEGGADNILKSLSSIYKKFLQIDETYCYNSDGNFAMLLHYRDEDGLKDRLKTLLSAIHVLSRSLSQIFDISVVFGIYEINRDNQVAVPKMIDFAQAAKASTSNNDVDNLFRFYNDDLKAGVMLRAEIEARMDNALTNDEYKLFYQPKYNIARDTLDGCEILVRWYDPFKEQYRVPGEFLPVFEQNGFIIKLDHYVYVKACETLAKEIKNGDQTYQVSVNVSRLTAIQDDFVDFYISTKKKYGIRDGLMTIELTESFAYDNFDYLKKIIDQLHKGGFKIAIDDFGSGYSSFTILKELKIDEIKLDRFFIQKGLSESRDQLILVGVIDMVKALGMTITQKGAENIEDFDRLRKLGCNLIQGFYYSKPLSYIDYRRFASERGSTYNPTLNGD